MPLTEQERLLLRIAHKGDPVEMAMLDPKIRAAREREEEAEVQRFFVRPKVQAAPEQGGGQTATVDSAAGGEERQPQIPSGDDNQKSNGNNNQKGNDKDNQKGNDRDTKKDNSGDNRKSNGGDNRKENGDKSAAPEPAVEPALPLPAMTQAVPQKTTTGENR
jgi:hypothetical protein